MALFATVFSTSFSTKLQPRGDREDAPPASLQEPFIDTNHSFADLLAAFVAKIAELERDHIRDRVKAGLDKGHRVGLRCELPVIGVGRENASVPVCSLYPVPFTPFVLIQARLRAAEGGGARSRKSSLGGHEGSHQTASPAPLGAGEFRSSLSP
jgi:hypothetical protein